MPRKKPKFEKLTISSERWGELRYDMAHSAIEAARKATRMTRQGWKVKVSARGPKALMTCTPKIRDRRNSDGATWQAYVARCTMTPAFKKRVRGR